MPFCCTGRFRAIPILLHVLPSHTQRRLLLGDNSILNIQIFAKFLRKSKFENFHIKKRAITFAQGRIRTLTLAAEL